MTPLLIVLTFLGFGVLVGYAVQAAFHALREIDATMTSIFDEEVGSRDGGER